ncbi:MAG: YciI family protein [Acidobacteriia bacterium]|nr:YciI family protein [Terriglobia bacterium]
MGFWVRTLLVTVPPSELEEALAGHLEHLRRLKSDGRLRAAGELGDGDGFLEIFEAADRREAEAVARSSPLVEDGLATWMLREWEELSL